MACFVLKGDDETLPEEGLKQPVTGHLRMLRGLPLPGSGTGSDLLILDRGDGEPSSLSNQPNRPPQNPEQPPEAPVPQGEEIEERISLQSHALQVHRSQGHFPYDVNCEGCCSSKGKVPARRLKRQLQKKNQTIGVDFYYFGKLRVLLLVHVASRYSMSIPAMELHNPNFVVQCRQVCPGNLHNGVVASLNTSWTRKKVPPFPKWACFCVGEENRKKVPFPKWACFCVGEENRLLIFFFIILKRPFTSPCSGTKRL